MGVHLSIGVRLDRVRHRRRAYALVGTFAVLFQAVLSAWHHHPASFHVRSAVGAESLAAPICPVVPALADHDCEICFALNHHGAVQVDLFLATRPLHAPLPRSRLAAVDTSPAPYILFRSRAPPLA
jgi:hypothetical protein